MKTDAIKKPKKPRTTRRSTAAFQQASKLFPGGVNSPVRSWKSVGGEPFFVMEAKGAELIDLDGNHYVDFIGSWGPMILGHCPSKVVAAVRKQALKGSSFGAPTELESRLALKVQSFFPSMEKMRFVSSGTEACMHVLRVARGFTGREKILKFDGCYHGASDPVLVKAGSGVATLGLPDSAGVPAASASNTLTAEFNNLEQVRAILSSNEIAAVILEPVVGNAGAIAPKPGFLEGLAAAAKAAGALLIFDEVMTGFRLSRGGAQEKYGIKPDLTTLGKILGGGLPCAAYGGRAEIMDKIAPLGPVYQAGTLSGNPLAMAAGLATLEALNEKGFYASLEKISAEIEALIRAEAKSAGWADRICLNRTGSMFTLFFCAGPVNSYTDAKLADAKIYARFFRALLEGGVYFPPSQYEAAFINVKMDRKIIKRVRQAVAAAFATLNAE